MGSKNTCPPQDSGLTESPLCSVGGHPFAGRQQLSPGGRPNYQSEPSPGSQDYTEMSPGGPLDYSQADLSPPPPPGPQYYTVTTSLGEMFPPPGFGPHHPAAHMLGGHPPPPGFAGGPPDHWPYAPVPDGYGHMPDYQFNNNNEPIKKRRGRKKRKVDEFAAMNGYMEVRE